MSIMIIYLLKYRVSTMKGFTAFDNEEQAHLAGFDHDAAAVSYFDRQEIDQYDYENEIKKVLINDENDLLALINDLANFVRYEDEGSED